MASTTMTRALNLPYNVTQIDCTIFGESLINGQAPLHLSERVAVVADFGVFIDTHRDLPHIASFESDIHRGFCKPTPVHWVRPSISTAQLGPMGFLVERSSFEQASSGNRPAKLIPVDEAHRFLTDDWWREFVMDHVLTHGRTPLLTLSKFAGMMYTSVLRDPRSKRYFLKSFRHIVIDKSKQR